MPVLWRRTPDTGSDRSAWEASVSVVERRWRLPVLVLVAFASLVLAGGCRRAKRHDRPSAKASTALSKSWADKRLHVWVTSCDPASEEVVDVLARIAGEPRIVTSVGVACTAVEEDGTPVATQAPGGRAAVAAKIAALGALPTLVVANPGPGGFDGPRAAAIVADPARRRRLVDATVDAAKTEGFRAIELDLEAMPSASAKDYVTLVRETAAAIEARAPGLELVVDVHPKTTDDPGWDGPGAHDYPALVAAGAALRLMTYDLSVGPVPPGPSTKASWIREVVAYARGKGIPPSKLEIGLPAYGYDFPPGSGTDAAPPPIPLRHADVRALRDRTSATLARDERGSPSFSYQGDAGRHEVWFDDAESLSRVLRETLPAAPDVRGVAIWGVGRADPALEEALRTAGFRKVLPRG
jgi:spore germination protein YaaH